MRTIIIISLVLVLPAILFAQQTYIPDDGFEQALIDRGDDTYPLNDSVPTANIERKVELWAPSYDIYDLTGIEDFANLAILACYYNKLTTIDLSNNYLEWLHCGMNNLTSLDVSNHIALESLYCLYNNLISLDVRNNPALMRLDCSENNLTSLDLSNNTSLIGLDCSENNLTSLDVSNHTALVKLHCESNNLTNLDLSNNSNLLWFYCSENNLTSLDFKNGNNKSMTGNQHEIYFDASGNPDLYCIQVDDSAWSANNEKWIKDDHAHYSEDCGYTGIDFQAEDETDYISISSYPNPFSQSTMINYTIENPAKVRIDVYDYLGKEISTLLNEFKDAGTHKAQFNAGNLPQGMYYYKIQIDNAIKSGKLLLIK